MMIRPLTENVDRLPQSAQSVLEGSAWLVQMIAYEGPMDTLFSCGGQSGHNPILGLLLAWSAAYLPEGV